MSQFQMVDVGGKQPTRRVAVAAGSLRMGAAAFKRLKAGTLPKGDALKLGEVAGVLAAKNAAAAIPLCHPLPLDRVLVSFALDAELPGVRARCEAATTAKTGVEMEALAGVTGALLAVYDLVKQVDAALTISDVRLETKTGGKSGDWRHPESEAEAAEKPPKRVRLGRASVITVSDSRSRGKAEDLSGPLLADGLREMGFSVGARVVVPDEREPIAAAVVKAAKHSKLVALTGGTGLSPRDVTPETVAALCDRLIPGIGEALRADGALKLPAAALSRSLAGQLGGCLVVCLPGSRGGISDALRVLEPLLPHALHVMAGGGH